MTHIKCFLEKVRLDLFLEGHDITNRVFVPARQIVASHAVHPPIRLLVELVCDGNYVQSEEDKKEKRPHILFSRRQLHTRLTLGTLLQRRGRSGDRNIHGEEGRVMRSIGGDPSQGDGVGKALPVLRYCGVGGSPQRNWALKLKA